MDEEALRKEFEKKCTVSALLSTVNGRYAADHIENEWQAFLDGAQYADTRARRECAEISKAISDVYEDKQLLGTQAEDDFFKGMVCAAGKIEGHIFATINEPQE